MKLAGTALMLAAGGMLGLAVDILLEKQRAFIDSTLAFLQKAAEEIEAGSLSYPEICKRCSTYPDMPGYLQEMCTAMEKGVPFAAAFMDGFTAAARSAGAGNTLKQLFEELKAPEICGCGSAALQLKQLAGKLTQVSGFARDNKDAEPYLFTKLFSLLAVLFAVMLI